MGLPVYVSAGGDRRVPCGWPVAPGEALARSLPGQLPGRRLRSSYDISAFGGGSRVHPARHRRPRIRFAQR